MVHVVINMTYFLMEAGIYKRMKDVSQIFFLFEKSSDSFTNLYKFIDCAFPWLLNTLLQNY